MVKRRKKICPKCGRKLWLRDFYKTANGRVSSACKECTRQDKRDEYARNRKVPNRLYQDPVTGKSMHPSLIRFLVREHGKAILMYSCMILD